MIAASQRLGSAVHVGDGKGVAAASNAPLLVVAKPVVHSISAPVSVILSGTASSQKSFLCEFTTDFLQHSKQAPSCVAGGSAESRAVFSYSRRDCHHISYSVG